MMTGSSCCRSLICGNRSRPLCPGSARSRSTKSKFSSSRMRSPCSPSPAIRTWYPSRVSRSSRDSRIPASSSMTRMLALPGVLEERGADKFKGESTSGMDRIPRQRKLKMEGCAGADRALHVDFSRVFLDDAVGHGEAEPRAPLVPRLGSGLGGEEWIVDALQVLGSDAGAGIADQRFDMSVDQRGHPQAAAAGHGFLGVQKEIEKDLLQLSGVAVNGRKLGCQIEVDLHLRRLELVLQQR